MYIWLRGVMIPNPGSLECYAHPLPVLGTVVPVPRNSLQNSSVTAGKMNTQRLLNYQLNSRAEFMHNPRRSGMEIYLLSSFYTWQHWTWRGSHKEHSPWVQGEMITSWSPACRSSSLEFSSRKHFTFSTSSMHWKKATFSRGLLLWQELISSSLFTFSMLVVSLSRLLSGVGLSSPPVSDL